jgi:hypothetical protein
MMSDLHQIPVTDRRQHRARGILVGCKSVAPNIVAWPDREDQP